MPTPLTDADKVLRNDTGKDIVEKLDDIAQALGVGVNADQINYDNTESGLEAEDVQNAIDEVNDKFVNTKTITNVPIASFNDGAKAPVKSLTTLITPIQSGSGVPSPSNVRSISGVSDINLYCAGKNIYPIDYSHASQTVSGITFSFNNDGSVEMTGTATANTYHYPVMFRLHPGTYKKSSVANDIGILVQYVVSSSSWTLLSAATATEFTVTEEISQYPIVARVRVPNSKVLDHYKYYPFIYVGSETDLSFEKYIGRINNIPLGSTVYGGSLECVEGEGQITWGMVTLNQFDFSTLSTPENHIFRAEYQNVLTNFDAPSASTVVTSAICERFNAKSYQDITLADDGCFSISRFNVNRINFIDSGASTVEQFLQRNGSSKLVFPLATPTSLSVTGANIPTLSGTNNLYSSSGGIEELTYFTQSSDKTEELIRSTSYTKDETNDLISNSLDISTEITTPAPVQTFDDSGDNIPLKSLVTEIVPVQSGSGVPSPSNVRAITGFDTVNVDVCGKNFNQITETTGSYNGITYTFNDDGTISASGSVPSGNSYKNVGHFILQAGTYTISGLPSSLVAEARKCAMVLCKDAYSGSANIIKTIYSNVALSDQFTLTETTDCYLRIYTYHAAGTISDVIFAPQIELGETATSFEKFKGTIHTIPLGQTVYGGSLECVKGEGQITHGYLELDGSNDEQFNWVPSGSTVYINMLVSDIKGGTIDGACNWLQVHNESTQLGVRLGASSTSKYILFDRITENISDVTDLASWRTYLSNHPLQVVYPLATPTSLSVTGANIPTLSGLNNVYTDCSDIQSLEYYNNKTDELANLIRLMTRS